MDFQLLARQNPWWTDAAQVDQDQTLTTYSAQAVRWIPRLLDRFTLDRDRVYSMRGPRQVGKTTLIKLLLRRLVEEQRFDPRAILYFSCDLVRDAEQLDDLVETYLRWQEPFRLERRVILLDEVSSVRDWSTAIRSLANRGRLKGCSIVLTGSHALDVVRQTERLPGRRGESPNADSQDLLDKVLLPMSFAEYVGCLRPDIGHIIKAHGLNQPSVRVGAFESLFTKESSALWSAMMPLLDTFQPLLADYLITGGFPRPVNDLRKNGRISRETYDVYIRVLTGDLARWQHDERTARELLAAIVEKLGTPVSWRTLALETGLASHNTAAKYVESLERTFTLQTVYQYDVRRKRHSPRKSRKLYIPDAFLFHCVRGWSTGLLDSFDAAREYVENPRTRGPLLEAIVADHLARLAYASAPSSIFDAYERVLFWRSKKGWEADFVVRVGAKPRALQVTASRPRSEDLRALKTFGGGVVLTEMGEGGSFPLPLLLLIA